MYATTHNGFNTSTGSPAPKLQLHRNYSKINSSASDLYTSIDSSKHNQLKTLEPYEDGPSNNHNSGQP